jgi:hypothetical protein
MTVKRLYVDPANSYAYLNAAVLQGLGSANENARTLIPNTKWPRGRSYYDVATFRAPYKTGYYQDGSLLGLGGVLGAVPTSVATSIDAGAPPEVKRFLLSGEPVPTLSKNVQLPFNQIPRMGYGVAALAALGLSYFSYKRFKKNNPSKST